MEFQEFTGDNVDLAINEACTRLQVPSFELEYEVINKESAGFLGFGKKPARIRARKKEVQEKVKAEPMQKQEPKKKEEKPVKKVEASAPVVEEKKEEAVKNEFKKEPKNRNGKKKNFDKKPKNVSGEEKKEAKREPKKEQPRREQKPEPVVVERSEEEIKAIKKAAEDFLKEVFAAMELAVELNIQYNKETGNLEIDFAGDDMGILIGKRGQTLDSLQYLTNLAVNKHSDNYYKVKIDTEDYRKRRKETLENLAKNIAYKVKRTKRSVSLEPMNPFERRIIHSALQNDRYVTTHSEGDEPYRHVVVTLKK